jgi:iron complex transport system substrate-binding protein
MMRPGLGALHLGLTLALGAAVALAPAHATEEAKRLVSLGGSVTEIVVALGAGDRLIARDSTSTYPESIQSLPDVGYVRALSAEGVLALGPDLILAEDGAGPPEAVEVLKAAGIPFVTMPNAPSPDGIVAKIEAVAEALALEPEGAALAQEVKAGLDAAAARAASVPDPKRVLFLLSVQGGRVMAGGAGSSAEGIIELAGGVNAATGFQGYKPMTDEAIIAAAPDVILMMDREGDLSITDADILAQPALAATPAAKSGRILRMDGMLLLGFGPRTPEAAQKLHDALYPSAG